MKKYTKEDWINGLVALKFDENDSLRINKFFEECNPRNTNAGGHKFYYCFKTNPGYYFPSDKNIHSLPEVTLDELIETKKIIGYKAPYDLFKGRIKKGDIFSLYSADSFVMYNEKHKTSGIPTEIVHEWEKVYEEDEIKFGDYKVEFRNNTIKINDVYYTLSQLNTLKLLMKKGQIKSLNCGCQGQYKVDLVLVEKIIKKLCTIN